MFMPRRPVKQALAQPPGGGGPASPWEDWYGYAMAAAATLLIGGILLPIMPGAVGDWIRSDPKFLDLLAQARALGVRATALLAGGWIAWRRQEQIIALLSAGVRKAKDAAMAALYRLFDRRPAPEPVEEEPVDAGGGPLEDGLPPLDILSTARDVADDTNHSTRAGLIQQALAAFGVSVVPDGWDVGPAVTRYRYKVPPGVSLSKIQSRQDDLALALGTESALIQPVPGRAGTVGVEVPNAKVRTVALRPLLDGVRGRKLSPLAVAVGKDVTGRPYWLDLAHCPHLLVAGATGGGKSVLVHVMLASLLFRHGPDRLRLALVDPKVVEFNRYDGLPHLLRPVGYSPEEALDALNWAVDEMNRRYRVLAEAKARDIGAYHDRGGGEPMPYVVMVVDEVADLMADKEARKDVETAIQRLAQKARGAGIHLILATQRPSVDVITGVIKANFPARIALAVSSETDSRVILDHGGAERLLGRGDMLALGPGASAPVRVQGAFVSDQEVERLVGWWASNPPQGWTDDAQTAAAARSAANPDASVPAQATPAAPGGGTAKEAGGQGDDDPIWTQVGIAARFVARQGFANRTSIQRTLRINNAAAGRVLQILEEEGIVGPPRTPKPREVLVTAQEADEMFPPAEYPLPSEGGENSR